jgi:hypothetical protein
LMDGSSEYWDSAAVAWLVRLGLVPYEAGATAKHNVLESALPNPNLALMESTARPHSPGMPALLLARLRDSANVRPPAQRRLLKCLGDSSLLKTGRQAIIRAFSRLSSQRNDGRQ